MSFLGTSQTTYNNTFGGDGKKKPSKLQSFSRWLGDLYTKGKTKDALTIKGSITADAGKVSTGLDPDMKNSMPDAYSDTIYDWTDETISKAGLAIPGKHPLGSKQIGKQIEGDLYRSLREKIDEYLDSVREGTPQAEIIHTIQDIIESWTRTMGIKIDHAFNDLYVRGLVAGILDSGVRPTFGMADKLAMEWIRQNPNRIGERIVTFAQDIVDRFKPIIIESYQPTGQFDIGSLVRAMKAIVPAKRYLLERIVRTEVAAISNYGRLLAWEKDPDKFFFEYHWQNTIDNRVKPISLMRGEGNPYTFDEIKFLWEHQEQIISGRWMADQYNQRCSISRAPLENEFIGNRFEGQEQNFRRTL